MMGESRQDGKEDGGKGDHAVEGVVNADQDPVQQQQPSQFEDDLYYDDFDPFLHVTVPRNLYNKHQVEGSKRWGPPTQILPFLFLGSCFCANEEDLLRDLGLTHILNVAEECPPPPTVAARKGDKLVKQYMMVDIVEQVGESENQWHIFETCFDFIDKARVAFEGTSGSKKKNKKKKRGGSKRLVRDENGGTTERWGGGIGLRLKLRNSSKDATSTEQLPPGAGNDRVLVHCMHGRSRSATIVLAYLMKKEGWTLREAYEHVKTRRPLVGPDKYLKHQLIEYEKHIFGKASFQSVEEFRSFQLQFSQAEEQQKDEKEKEKQKEAPLEGEKDEDEQQSSDLNGDQGDTTDVPKEITVNGDDDSSSTTSGVGGCDSDGGKKQKKRRKDEKKKRQQRKASSGEESTSGEDKKERKRREKQEKKEQKEKRKEAAEEKKKKMKKKEKEKERPQQGAPPVVD